MQRLSDVHRAPHRFLCIVVTKLGMTFATRYTHQCTSICCAGMHVDKGVMQQVKDAFTERFGDYAEWAHNTLFMLVGYAGKTGTRQLCSLFRTPS